VLLAVSAIPHGPQCDPSGRGPREFPSVVAPFPAVLSIPDGNHLSLTTTPRRVLIDPPEDVRQEFQSLARHAGTATRLHNPKAAETALTPLRRHGSRSGRNVCSECTIARAAATHGAGCSPACPHRVPFPLSAIAPDVELSSPVLSRQVAESLDGGADHAAAPSSRRRQVR